ncbi:alpha/beta fold hydrolase [Frigidibacter sp.]|uniref:alpha/beta fold hydrolase n=1 Tax=Frigidibacter sp. TaxID=2586418 RepID=UPI0027356664|nr:alpha/beta hydrolase [Frigidibacter sp.]MDP3339309.1 alpha/beta hydrolase [Frigidibacter sp.]
MNWVEANGAVLRYVRSGDWTSGRIPVVLLHEAGGAIESWAEVAALLSPSWQVLAYDQRGFGQSERAKVLDLATMTADLGALLEALGIERAHLVGTAMGGTIALAFAAESPDRVASVVTNSPATGNVSEVAQKNLLARADYVERAGMRAVADAGLEKAYPEGLRGAGFAQYRLRYLTNDPASVAALSRMFVTLDLGPLVPRITAPTLILGCTLDPIKPLEECRTLAGQLPDGRYGELVTGHFAGLISPGPFAAVITGFLESLDA